MKKPLPKAPSVEHSLFRGYNSSSTYRHNKKNTEFFIRDEPGFMAFGGFFMQQWDQVGSESRKKERSIGRHKERIMELKNEIKQIKETTESLKSQHKRSSTKKDYKDFKQQTKHKTIDKEMHLKVEEAGLKSDLEDLKEIEHTFSIFQGLRGNLEAYLQVLTGDKTSTAKKHDDFGTPRNHDVLDALGEGNLAFFAKEMKRCNELVKHAFVIQLPEKIGLSFTNYISGRIQSKQSPLSEMLESKYIDYPKPIPPEEPNDPYLHFDDGRLSPKSFSQPVISEFVPIRIRNVRSNTHTSDTFEHPHEVESNPEDELKYSTFPVIDSDTHAHKKALAQDLYDTTLGRAHNILFQRSSAYITDKNMRDFYMSKRKPKSKAVIGAKKNLEPYRAKSAENLLDVNYDIYQESKQRTSTFGKPLPARQEQHQRRHSVSDILDTSESQSYDYFAGNDIYQESKQRTSTFGKPPLPARQEQHQRRHSVSDILDTSESQSYDYFAGNSGQTHGNHRDRTGLIFKDNVGSRGNTGAITSGSVQADSYKDFSETSLPPPPPPYSEDDNMSLRSDFSETSLPPPPPTYSEDDNMSLRLGFSETNMAYLPFPSAQIHNLSTQSSGSGFVGMTDKTHQSNDGRSYAPVLKPKLAPKPSKQNVVTDKTHQSNDGRSYAPVLKPKLAPKPSRVVTFQEREGARNEKRESGHNIGKSNESYA